jgi:predicted methyltransferase
MTALPSAVQWSHHFLQSTVQSGDWVVDATAGNGHDTLFLAHLVGAAGRVFAFDIQQAALQSTRTRLGPELEQHCQLIHASHHEMAQHLPTEATGRLAAVIFNLGYLPGAAKTCITHTHTTLLALDAALHMLRSKGVLLVVVYPGHPGGDEEAAAVAAKLTTLPWHSAEVQHIRSANSTTRSPECWVVLKRS